MKRYIVYFISFTLTSLQLVAQKAINQNDITQNSSSSVTGITQDLFTNLLQFSANNITSSNKSFTLSSNLFALNFKDSIDKYKNIYYKKHSYQRNTLISLSGGLDQNSKINSIQGGLSYNFINDRDTTLINYWNDMSHGVFNNIVATAAKIATDKKTKEITHYLDSISLATYLNKDTSFYAEKVGFKYKIFKTKSDNEKKFRYNNIKNELYITIKNTSYDINKTVIHKFDSSLAEYIFLTDFGDPLSHSFYQYINDNGEKQIQSKDSIELAFVKEILDSIDLHLNHLKIDGKDTSFKKLSDVYVYLNLIYDSLTVIYARRPLLTLSNNFNYQPDSSKSSNVAALNFVMSLNGKSLKKEWDLTAYISDTTKVDTLIKDKSLGRNIGVFSVGINRVLYMYKKSSLLELKISVEDDYILSGIYRKEPFDKFYFSSTLRARLPNTPWLKFNIKYDPKGSFFGFLDLTLNLDNSSSSSGSGNSSTPTSSGK